MRKLASGYQIFVPDYDFQQLSPTDFERLTRDVLNAEFGWSLQDYGPGADGGIDLRHEDPDGTVTIVQCKHYARSAAQTLLRAAAKEGKRNPPLRADRYVFVTSQSLSPQLQDGIHQALRALPIRKEDVWGREALNRSLEDHPEVERRNVKLWLTSTGILDAFFHAGRLNRADAEIEFAADNWKLWVETEQVEIARGVLRKNGFCVLYGPPGAGKTTLARMVLLSMLRDGWQLVPVSGDVEEAWEAWVRDDGVRQVFWFDDFLGERVSQLAKNEDARLMAFVARAAAVPERRRLLMTVREQTLGEARASTSEHLRELARRVRAGASVRVGQYSERTRAEILYNHLYFSDLPESERERLPIDGTADGRVTEIVRHPGFSPRLISVGVAAGLSGTGGAAGARERTADGVLSGIERALNHPDEVWETSFERLDRGSQRILLALATLPFRPWPLDDVLRLAGIGDDAALAWRSARHVLSPTWLSVRRDHVELASQSGHGYLLDRLDDPPVAARWVARIQTVDQVRALTKACGLLSGTVTRPELAAALRERRSALAALIWSALDEGDSAFGDYTSAWAVRDAADCLAVYGSDEDFEGLAELVSAVADAVALGFEGEASAVFALAARLADLPAGPGYEESPHADVARRAVLDAVREMRTAHDLDAYEALPRRLRTEEIASLARERAQEIIAAGLDDLVHTGQDPEVIRSLVAEASARARWYGITNLDVTPLLDRAEDLEAEIFPRTDDSDGGQTRTGIHHRHSELLNVF